MDCRVKPGNDELAKRDSANQPHAASDYAASAASRLPFSTAASMVPTM
jgi:hypothetical protein